MLKQQIQREAQKEFDEYKEQQELERAELEEQHNQTMIDLNTRLEDETKQKEFYYTDLQRRKGETNNLYEGGFGTFTLAFENPFYN